MSNEGPYQRPIPTLWIVQDQSLLFLISKFMSRVCSTHERAVAVGIAFAVLGRDVVIGIVDDVLDGVVDTVVVVVVVTGGDILVHLEQASSNRMCNM
jgi:hypothetical protein